MDPLVLPPPLWHTLREKLNPSEELEVKRILGWADVERNEELHQEAAQLLEILHEYRERVDCEESHCVQRQMQLARDPEWEFLHSEIAAFVDALRKRGVEQPLPKQILNSVCAATPVSQTRPFSAHEHPAAVAVRPAQVARLDVRRPTTSGVRPSTASCSSRSRADTDRSLRVSDEDILEAASCLSLETIERCAGSLQSRLRREADTLMQNIAVLHLALDDERDRQDAVASAPSLDELRQTSSKLQAEIVSRSFPELGCSERIARGRLRSRTMYRPASAHSDSD
jgi:hypothetical protein